MKLLVYSWRANELHLPLALVVRRIHQSRADFIVSISSAAFFPYWMVNFLKLCCVSLVSWHLTGSGGEKQLRECKWEVEWLNYRPAFRKQHSPFCKVNPCLQLDPPVLPRISLVCIFNKINLIINHI